MRVLTGDEIEVDVGSVAHGGHCVARHEGRVVFVRHALPGERVRARLTAGGPGSRFLRADAVEVLVASPDRVAPPCPYAGPGRCGGCDWQHVALDAQRRLKAEVVTEQLRRLAGIDRVVTVEPVPGDEDGLGWRTRVSYTIDADGSAGFRRHRSHDVIPVDRCLIAHPAVDATGVTRACWPGVDAVEVTVSARADRSVVVRPTEGGRRPVRLPEVDATSVLMGTGRGATVVRGRRYVSERAAGRSWRVSGGFWQVHPGAAETLVAAVLDALRPAPGERALDLYSGVGLFAGALADRLGSSGSVVAVEGSRAAVGDARRNLHDVRTVRLVNATVENWIRHSGLDGVDLVVLDPPRSGARRQVVEQIASLRPRAIAYVACDPAALARDVAYFATAGYDLAAIRAFDLFPMTQHVECLATLARTAGST